LTAEVLDTPKLLGCNKKTQNPDMKVFLPKINLMTVLTMSVTCAAALSVREETVLFVSGLLHAERQRHGTRTGNRALAGAGRARALGRAGPAVVPGLHPPDAVGPDNAIGKSTAYDLPAERHRRARACTACYWPPRPPATAQRSTLCPTSRTST